MKQLILLFLFSLPILAMDHPIKIKLKKNTGNSYRVSVTIQEGFAIQKKEAPNKIKFSSEDKITVKPIELTFKGDAMVDHPEYYEKVQDNFITISGKGRLKVSAKIFYCDLNKNVCYPASIEQEELIQ